MRLRCILIWGLPAGCTSMYSHYSGIEIKDVEFFNGLLNLMKKTAVINKSPYI